MNDSLANLTLHIDHRWFEDSRRIRTDGDHVIAHVHVLKEPGDQQETAERLIACWRACRGIETADVLHSVGYRELQETLLQLIGAVKAAHEQLIADIADQGCESGSQAQQAQRQAAAGALNQAIETAAMRLTAEQPQQMRLSAFSTLT